MSEKENVVIEVTEILDENTESTDKQYIDENIDDLQNKVFNQIGLTVLDNKLKKKVVMNYNIKITILKVLHLENKTRKHELSEP